MSGQLPVTVLQPTLTERLKMFTSYKLTLLLNLSSKKHQKTELILKSVKTNLKFIDQVFDRIHFPFPVLALLFMFECGDGEACFLLTLTLGTRNVSRLFITGQEQNISHKNQN